MDRNRENSISIQEYGELWNFNLQKIEDIHSRLEMFIRKLEAHYSEFENLYADIMAQAEILSSIYAAYNTIRGAEDVLKLVSVLRSFQKRYTREEMDFDLIHRLLERIRIVRDASFEEFPVLSHLSPPPINPEGEADKPSHEEMPFRWITFERNRSRFITQYNRIDVRETRDAEISSHDGNDILKVVIQGTAISVSDIFSRHSAKRMRPRFIIFLDDGRRNYAADRIGKRIFARHDFVSTMAEPFSTPRGTIKSPGRVRLFGVRHIILP